MFVLTAFLIGPILLTIVVLIEYKSYSKTKQKKLIPSKYSFIEFLKSRLKRDNQIIKKSQRLSKDTIEIIEDIIQENKSK